jgi:hypothetical protein
VSSRPWSFKLTDVKRAIKAAAQAGQQVIGFEITKAGNILVHIATGRPTPVPTDDWDEALANDR